MRLFAPHLTCTLWLCAATCVSLLVALITCLVLLQAPPPAKDAIHDHKGYSDNEFWKYANFSVRQQLNANESCIVCSILPHSVRAPFPLTHRQSQDDSLIEALNNAMNTSKPPFLTDSAPLALPYRHQSRQYSLCIQGRSGHYLLGSVPEMNGISLDGSLPFLGDFGLCLTL